MTDIKKAGALEVDEDPDFERREWTVQRVAWILLVIFVLAALAGFFGHGPAALAYLGQEGEPFEMKYSRFARFKAPIDLDVKLRPAAGQAPQLWFSSNYLKSLRIEHVSPEPAQTQVNGDGVLYTFEAAEAEQPIEVSVHSVAEGMGRLSGRAGPSKESAQAFWQFVYP